jgi:hypothetical protein
VRHARTPKRPSISRRYRSSRWLRLKMGLFTAQSYHRGAGDLTAKGALGGPKSLATFHFYIGINDNVADPHGPFDAKAMRLYEAWRNDAIPIAGSSPGEMAIQHEAHSNHGSEGDQRQPVFRLAVRTYQLLHHLSQHAQRWKSLWQYLSISACRVPAGERRTCRSILCAIRALGKRYRALIPAER